MKGSQTHSPPTPTPQPPPPPHFGAPAPQYHGFVETCLFLFLLLTTVHLEADVHEMKCKLIASLGCVSRYLIEN